MDEISNQDTVRPGVAEHARRDHGDASRSIGMPVEAGGIDHAPGANDGGWGDARERIAAELRASCAGAPAAHGPPPAATTELQTPTAASALLFDYLCSLRKHLPHLSAAETPHVIQATNSLMKAGLKPQQDARDEGQTAINAMLFHRVQRYIDSHLSSPELTPERICKEVGISRSKLYQLFEPSGGVMRVVQRQRLKRIRDILSDPSRPKMRIAEIAWCHGFVSEKHFSRVYKAEFGHTPRDTVAHARQAGAAG
ncbi:helix-turn-helix domain-containing protein [Burkholderia alba]|uniref:helix-turn-helix domain-containing protein n=1 Tax=Burkholderia alba TaxID=2683677 RepID=UPI002B0538D2|nr:helix-turn-helix domain-containing protein [Burkholderia alba]